MTTGDDPATASVRKQKALHLLSFHDTDHGDGSGPPRPSLEAMLAEAGITFGGGPILAKGVRGRPAGQPGVDERSRGLGVFAPFPFLGGAWERRRVEKYLGRRL